MSVTEDIKSRLDIVELISEGVQLRKSGRSYGGFCPFHPNTKTPSFYVFPHTQTWHCFGACSEGGDVFTYVMKREGLEFRDALELLARRAGIELEEFSPEQKEKKAQGDRLAGILNAAADYFHQLLLYAPQAEGARRYVDGRQLSESTLAEFKVGFALNSWDACRTHFMAHGYSEEELLAVGLLTKNDERGTVYDRFRNRLIIPISDVSGRVVGFGARALAKEDVPKYLNSPQTELFDKSRLLFGLDKAKHHVREARQAVIAEGYMDVITAWQAGFRNVVAQMGTALTEHQLRLLKRYTRRFVLALDADAAGAQATLRSLDVARQTLDRDTEIRFDARGLVRHEGRLQADIRVITMPVGEDPDSIIRSDLAQWPQLLDQAKPVVSYVLDVATSDLDMEDPKAKADVARQIVPLINDIADPVERDHYWQLLGRKLNIDDRTLRRLQQVGNETPRSAVVTRQTGRNDDHRSTTVAAPASANAFNALTLEGGMIATRMREANYLRHCIAYPQIMERVDRRLKDAGLDTVAERDFASAEDRQLFKWLKEQGDRRHIATVEDLWDILDRSLFDRVRFLLTLPSVSDTEQRLPDTLALSILDWRLEKLRHTLRQIQVLFRQGVAQEELIRVQQQQLVQISRLNKAKFAMSSLSRRD